LKVLPRDVTVASVVTIFIVVISL